MDHTLIEHLCAGNRRYLAGEAAGDVSAAIRLETAENGQHPKAIVIACSDSRVIPEAVFSAGIGELFVIRVAGNVLDNHQLGSIEYAAAHLDCRMIIVLGHTGCGAVHAALAGEVDGFTQYITDEILLAVGDEKDEERACRLNVQHAVETIRREFAAHPEIPSAELDVVGAVYDIATGAVRWLEE
jgi:carbonic anhydrase